MLYNEEAKTTGRQRGETGSLMLEAGGSRHRMRHSQHQNLVLTIVDSMVDFVVLPWLCMMEFLP